LISPVASASEYGYSESYYKTQPTLVVTIIKPTYSSPFVNVSEGDFIHPWIDVDYNEENLTTLTKDNFEIEIGLQKASINSVTYNQTTSFYELNVTVPWNEQGSKQSFWVNVSHEGIWATDYQEGAVWYAGFPPIFNEIYPPTSSYIHRNKDSPLISETVRFWVNITDLDNSTDELTVILWYSTDKITWFNVSMSNTSTGNSAIWEAFLTFNSEVTIYYFVNVTDGISTIRSPEVGYDSISWVSEKTTTTTTTTGPTRITRPSGPGMMPATTVLKDFTIDKDFIQVILAQGETERRTIKVSNTGDTKLTISMHQVNLEKFLTPLETSFDLEPAETKEIELNFSASQFQEPGVYPGRIILNGDGVERKIIILVEVESETLLFDVKVEVLPEYREVYPGESVTAKLTLYNLGRVRRADVNVEYGLKDLKGNTIVKREEMVAIETSLSLTKSFDLPIDLKAGNYVFYATVNYDGLIGTGSDMFIVLERKKLPILNMLLIISLIIMLILLTLYITKRVEKIGIKRKIKRKKKKFISFFK